MRSTLAILSFCTASLCAAVSLQPAQAAESLYWYSNGAKISIYHHRDLYAVPAHEDSPARRRGSMNDLGQKDGWEIYRSKNVKQRTMADHDYFQLYSSSPDWRNSDIYTQAPGVIVIFKEGMPVQQIRQWFTQEKLQGKRLSSDDSYLIPDIYGENAVRLAARVFESGVADVAQPNWALRVSD
jgi:hypothetical protein